MQTATTIIRYSSWFFNLPSAVKADKSFKPQKARYDFYKRKLFTSTRKAWEKLHTLLMHLLKNVCVYMLRLKKHLNMYCMILYGIFTNIQKATILQTSKNTPRMKKAKSQKAFQPQLWQLKCQSQFMTLKKKKRQAHAAEPVRSFSSITPSSSGGSDLSLITHTSGTHSWCQQKYI